jgi:hypothetical protein
MNDLGISQNDLVMSGDTSGFKYFTGRGGVVTVSDPVPVIGTVAKAYGIRWLILERSHIVDTLGDVLKGTERPDWLGPPVWTLDETPPNDANDTYPDIALYPVCTTPGDNRCPGASSTGAPSAAGVPITTASPGASAAP